MIYFLKNIVNSVRTLIQKKGIEEVIRKFDASVGVGLSNDFLGYAFKSNIVDPSHISEPKLVDPFGMYTSRYIDNKIASYTLCAIKEFKPLITEYLGSDCRLDDLGIHWFYPGRAVRRGISGGWHDDNCGHRLKLYICIEGDGSTPTVFLPGSHRKPYRFKMVELSRFLGFSNTSTISDEVYLRYKGGDIAIFDTNGRHRGLYEEPASNRVVIIAEFINRHKSNAISGRAPCGPGSSPNGEVIFDSEAWDTLSVTGLLDDSIASQKSSKVHYSLAYYKQ